MTSLDSIVLISHTVDDGHQAVAHDTVLESVTFSDGWAVSCAFTRDRVDRMPNSFRDATSRNCRLRV